MPPAICPSSASEVHGVVRENRYGGALAGMTPGQLVSAMLKAEALRKCQNGAELGALLISLFSEGSFSSSVATGNSKWLTETWGTASGTARSRGCCRLQSPVCLISAAFRLAAFNQPLLSRTQAGSRRSKPLCPQV